MRRKLIMYKNSTSFYKYWACLDLSPSIYARKMNNFVVKIARQVGVRFCIRLQLNMKANASHGLFQVLYKSFFAQFVDFFRRSKAPLCARRTCEWKPNVQLKLCINIELLIESRFPYLLISPFSDFYDKRNLSPIPSCFALILWIG